MKYLATLDGAEHELEIEETSGHSYAVRVGTQRFEIDLRRVGTGSFSILVGERAFDFDVTQQGDETAVASRTGVYRVSLIDERRRAMRAAAGATRHISGPAELRAMMPGRVVKVLVKAGDEVETNQGVLVVEAMKMENEIKAPKAGRVVDVKVAEGQTVEKGVVMAVIE